MYLLLLVFSVSLTLVPDPANLRKADSLVAEGQYLEAAAVLEKLLRENKDELTADQQLEALYKTGFCYLNISREPLAKDYFQKVLASGLSDTPLSADAMSGLGRCYEYMGKHDSAFYWYLEAYRRVEQTSDIERKARDARNLAQLLRFLGRMEEAKAYGRQALELAPWLKDYRVVANIYNETAYLHELSGELDSAAHYYRKLIDISIENNFHNGESVGYSNLADVLEQEKQYDEALRLKMKGLEIDREINDHYGMMTSWRTISETLHLMGRYDESLEALDSAAALCGETYIVDRMGIEEGYYRTYRALGDYASALDHLEKQNALKDSVNTAESEKKVSELLTRYETEAKEQQLLIFEQENTIQKNKIRMQGVVIAGLLLLGASLSIIGWLWIRSKNQALKRMSAELHHFILAAERDVTHTNAKQEIDPEEAYSQWGLTGRESEILFHMARGNSNAAIAEKLFISENTVKYHLKNIYIKLDVKNRIQALIMANGKV